MFQQARSGDQLAALGGYTRDDEVAWHDTKASDSESADSVYDRRITMFVTVCACRGLKKIKIFRIVELDKPSLNLHNTETFKFLPRFLGLALPL